jgi:UTP--glucose-1-phosphate uridylyltransferase
MTKVRQAILPVAGMGTRFLPATKVQPKEMLPIFDTPAIQLIVEEAVAAGIEKIIFVISEEKHSIRHHFSPHEALENLLTLREKKEELEIVQRLTSLAEFEFAFQDKPLGDGHAILCAREFIDPSEPVVILFGDDLVDNPKGKNAVEQLLELYDKYQESVVLLEEIDPKDTKKYGIVDFVSHKGQEVRISNVVEKPLPEDAPSYLGIVGKYVITPNIWEKLSQIDADQSGEVRLSGAFAAHLKKGGTLFGRVLEGKRFDTGDKLGFLRASVHYAQKAGINLKDILA